MADGARRPLGPVPFQHRFDSVLNQQVYLHACVTNGVFEWASRGGGATFYVVRPVPASGLVTVT